MSSAGGSPIVRDVEWDEAYFAQLGLGERRVAWQGIYQQQQERVGAKGML